MEISKWHLPGWRIEQRYNNRVLIGNWNEERREFRRGNWKSNSTHRTDFTNYRHFVPDNKNRQYAILKNEGLDKKLLFSHSGAYKNYSSNMISWYDQQFNGREQRESSLPMLRAWDGRTLAWAPERSDHPLQGTPTNFGLLAKKQARLVENSNSVPEYQTTYEGSYKSLPGDSFVKHHFSTPRHLSSHFSPHIKINKDLHLRSATICTAQEHPPNTLLLPA
ncbi:cilia- and flagella-associated protein 107-like [Rhopilema esculentum]|uniref:cilia- and flagella-associated protein 107-like n=1 Tax=Rhopilema esculentum TaxID=499914 RepID=UPI0031CE6D5B|eukprot:gene6730-12293_t